MLLLLNKTTRYNLAAAGEEYKKGENFNPERNYVIEFLFKALGGYFFWLINGKGTTLKEELQKDIRNVITSLIFYILILVNFYYL